MSIYSVSEQCGKISCVHGKCNWATESCICKKGYEGKRCELMEVNFDSSHGSKYDPAYEKSFIVVSISIIVGLFLVLTVGLFVWSKIHKRRKKQKNRKIVTNCVALKELMLHSRNDQMFLVYQPDVEQLFKSNKSRDNIEKMEISFQISNNSLQEVIRPISPNPCAKDCFNLNVDQNLQEMVGRGARRKRSFGISR